VVRMKGRTPALIVLAALVLAGCAYQAPPRTLSALDFTLIWPDWAGVAARAVLMSAFFVSIAYMLGSFLNNTAIIRWAKSELMQVFASALIIGGLLWLVGIVTALSASAVSYTGIDCTNTAMEHTEAGEEIALSPCHINVAQQYLQIMYENVFHEARDLLIAGSLLAAIANFNISLEMLPPPWLTFTVVPFAPLNMVYEVIALVFDMLTKIMLMLKFQIYFLSFVWRALFPMTLVLGVVLRTFFFSRKLGGLLIAIAMGMYLAYPLTYALSYYVLGGTSLGSYVVKVDVREYEEDEGIKFTTEDFRDMGDVAERINKLERKNMLGDILSVGAVGALAAPGMVVGGAGALAPGAPIINNWVVGDDGIIESTAKLLIYAVFVPFLALMATLSFVKVLSPVLGGDIEIAGITHLI